LPTVGETLPEVPVFSGDIVRRAWELSRAGLSTTITGGLSYPSKMDCPAWGIPASTCRVGSRLVEVADSVCRGCYALKAGTTHIVRRNG